MSMPAGWYDDGSGRQRWWDGARWTEHVAPGAAVPAAGAAGPVQLGPPPSAARVRRNASAVGIFGLGLAGFGTVIGSLESSYIAGIVALIVGFVMSLVGLFMRNTSKWPALAGLLLSILGAAFATVVVFGIGFLNLGEPIGGSDISIPAPAIQATEQPSIAPAGSQPSPEEIAVGTAALARADGITCYDDMPEFYPCVGQQLFESEISDESLRLVADGQDVTGAEREAVGVAVIEAAAVCDPLGEGVTG
ncbi:DUF2510 domain-containing protein [Microbacterium sp. ZW T5_45]|uniref:DUF2510 domain-containing protein n=1 Tax=Microbacterium sp. ZW T5_45 TaxID=3378080 RepID=UPI003852C9CE